MLLRSLSFGLCCFGQYCSAGIIGNSFYATLDVAKIGSNNAEEKLGENHLFMFCMAGTRCKADEGNTMMHEIFHVLAKKSSNHFIVIWSSCHVLRNPYLDPDGKQRIQMVGNRTNAYQKEMADRAKIISGVPAGVVH